MSVSVENLMTARVVVPNVVEVTVDAAGRHVLIVTNPGWEETQRTRTAQTETDAAHGDTERSKASTVAPARKVARKPVERHVLVADATRSRRCESCGKTKGLTGFAKGHGVCRRCMVGRKPVNDGRAKTLKEA